MLWFFWLKEIKRCTNICKKSKTDGSTNWRQKIVSFRGPSACWKSHHNRDHFWRSFVVISILSFVPLMQVWQRQHSIFNAGFDVIYMEVFAIPTYHTNGWVLLSLCYADTIFIAMQPTIPSILGKACVEVIFIFTLEMNVHHLQEQSVM